MARFDLDVRGGTIFTTSSWFAVDIGIIGPPTGRYRLGENRVRTVGGCRVVAANVSLLDFDGPSP